VSAGASAPSSPEKEKAAPVSNAPGGLGLRGQRERVAPPGDRLIEVTTYRDGVWADGEATAVRSFAALVELATRSNWSPGLFEDGHRATKSFRGEDVLGLDVDGGMTLERAVAVLGQNGLAGALLPTKSHQKEKDSKPPCDRFRVILPLSERITDPRDHLATWLAAVKLFDAVADPAAKDAARFFFKSNTVRCITEGNSFQVVRAPPPEPPKPRPDYRGSVPPHERWAKFVDSTMAKMDEQLAAGGGRHEAIHCAVSTLAGLHSGAGSGYPTREDVCSAAVVTLVSAGREQKTAELEVERSWKAGIERPFWPEERAELAMLSDPRPEPPPLEQDEPLSRLGTAETPLRLLHFPFDQFIEQPAADAEQLSTYLYRGALSMFNGEPGGNKSWLLLHEGLEAARDGHRVLYVALEGQKRKLQERIRRLTLEDDGKVLREFFHVSFQPGVDDNEGGRAFRLTDTAWVEAVLEELRRPEWVAEIVLIDPLADALEGDPDKEVDVRPAKDALKLLRVRLNLAIGLGHHTVKFAWTNNSGERDVKPSKAHARGSGAWMGTAEISVDVAPTPNQTPQYGEAMVSAVKARDYPDVPSERIFTVTDRSTADGRTVVVTALHDPTELQGASNLRGRYRRLVLEALEHEPLDQGELLTKLKLSGQVGRPILRELAGRTGCIEVIPKEQAKGLGFHPNATAYRLRSGVSDTPNSETVRESETGSTSAVVGVSDNSLESETHTRRASDGSITPVGAVSETTPSAERLCDEPGCPRPGRWEHPSRSGKWLCRPHQESVLAEGAP